ncbi:unnamed protein product [Rotaria sordida]|uniref:Uncharacterized protein n=1 Tax=Rotaria sordida TaxID=392033 RepID=A0A814ENY6_9BILA|nr:unnamed protein product [Rotaria sordida]CAF0971778.1 unnamed protein product [Rotaria sordida]
MLSLNDAAHNAEQYSAFVERHMDERRQRIEQLDAFVRHRLRLYRQAQEHVQRQTTNKIVEATVLPPEAPPDNTVVILSQRSSTPILEKSSSSSLHNPIEMTNRVRLSKQRLASKQLTQPINTSSIDDTQIVGTWLNPVPSTITDNDEQQQYPSSENTLRRSMSENRLSSFALKALTDSLTDGLTNVEKRKRLQATRALFMTIERRQVKEALLLNKQNKEMQRLVELKESERLHQEESLAQRHVSTIHTISDQSVLDVNSIDPKQLVRIRQQRIHEQKRRELERYIRALKTTLRERCLKRNINVPTLCSCHSTIWDADPMTCSQNCSFYRNPAAFATSLHSLLTSCQARTNLSVLPDVSVCLRDAMDLMFNNDNHNRLKQNGCTVITPDDNDVIVDIINDDDDKISTDTLQPSINKRKLVNTTTLSHEQQNDNEYAKRLCATNGHQ